MNGTITPRQASSWEHKTVPSLPWFTTWMEAPSPPASLLDHPVTSQFHQAHTYRYRTCGSILLLYILIASGPCPHMSDLTAVFSFWSTRRRTVSYFSSCQAVKTRAPSGYGEQSWCGSSLATFAMTATANSAAGSTASRALDLGRMARLVLVLSHKQLE